MATIWPSVTCWIFGFSFDARKHSLRDGHHWSDAEVLGTRSRFLLGTGGDTSRLILNDVRHSDEGLYRCRVDFKLSPTRNARVNLTVVGKYLDRVRLATLIRPFKPVQCVALGCGCQAESHLQWKTQIPLAADTASVLLDRTHKDHNGQEQSIQRRTRDRLFWPLKSPSPWRRDSMSSTACHLPFIGHKPKRLSGLQIFTSCQFCCLLLSRASSLTDPHAELPLSSRDSPITPSPAQANDCAPFDLISRRVSR